MNERLLALRKDLHMTRARFGEMLGVSDGVINNLERGRVDIKPHMVALICKTFGVNREWFETGEGEMYATPLENALEDLAMRYNLDERKKALLQAFLELGDAEQEAVVNFALGVAEHIRYLSNQELSESVEDEEERYRQSMGFQGEEGSGIG